MTKRRPRKKAFQPCAIEKMFSRPLQPTLQHKGCSAAHQSLQNKDFILPNGRTGQTGERRRIKKPFVHYRALMQPDTPAAAVLGRYRRGHAGGNTKTASAAAGNKQQLYGGLGPLRLAPAGHRRLPIHAIHLRLRARPHGVRAYWYIAGRAQNTGSCSEARQT